MLEKSKRKTKMIWSLEGQCLTVGHARALMEEDIDAVRLVYKPGEKQSICDVLRTFSESVNADRTPVMLDFASRIRARVEGLSEPQELTFGQQLTLSKEKAEGDGIQIESEEWGQGTLFEAGASVFIGFGSAVLRVISVNEHAARCEVTQGGVVHPSADVHVPATRNVVSLKEIGPNEDLRAFLELGVDFILVPGVYAPSDIQELKSRLKTLSENPPWVICKIDNDKVYENHRALLAEVDGILISRLELALTVNPANIPILTKEMIEGANAQAKVVFVASEMLGSMRHNATPTRAEVSDVANAVLDGADAVIASEEISYGEHSSRASRLMGRIVADVEEQSGVSVNWERRQPDVRDEMNAVAYGAFKTAERSAAKAIVCITENGNTALSLSSYRPPVPIIAVTFSEEVRRKLSLINGVTCMLLDAAPTIDDVLPLVSDLLLRQSWLEVGDKIVFVSITLSSVGREASNLFTIQTLR